VDANQSTETLIAQDFAMLRADGISHPLMNESWRRMERSSLMSNRPRIIKIDGLPDRCAHLRKIAERIKLDQPEFAADDPERSAEVPEGGNRVIGPTETGSGRGPHA
jgi:hypothetical protein